MFTPVEGEKSIFRSSLHEILDLVFHFRSMYFDEDGELAHEFYEEVMPKRGKGRRKMRRVCSKLLTPQGDVPYEPNPRLHTDCPVILYQG